MSSDIPKNELRGFVAQRDDLAYADGTVYIDTFQGGRVIAEIDVIRCPECGELALFDPTFIRTECCGRLWGVAP